MIYLDTSALVKLYLLEEGSGFVQSRVAAQDDPLPVWELQEAELTNALFLKVFRDELSAGEAEVQIALFHDRRKRGLYYFPDIRRGELMSDFQRLARETPKSGCRTMDILHVACALQIESCYFLTFDMRQRALARTAGLEIVEPNDADSGA